jgi:hypothetical protein
MGRDRSSFDPCDRRCEVGCAALIGLRRRWEFSGKLALILPPRFLTSKTPKGEKMQLKKKQSKRVSKLVYRAIKATPPAENADAGGGSRAAQEAVAAAALHQLNRYAADIEQFLQASKMRTLLDRLQAEIAPPVADQPPRMRLRAD